MNLMSVSALGDLARPAVAVSAEASLREVLQSLVDSGAVFVRQEHGWLVLQPAATAGYPDTRLVVDLPLAEVAELSPEIGIVEALTALENAGADVGLIHSGGEPAGYVTRADLEGAVREKARGYEQLGRQLSQSLATGRMLVWTLDLQGHFDLSRMDLSSLKVVGPLNDILGLEPGEFRETVVGEIDRLVHPEDAPALRAWLADLDEGREDAPNQARFRGAGGRWVWLRNTARIVRGPQGAPDRLEGLSIDISKSVARHEQDIMLSRLHETLSRRKPLDALETVSRDLLDLTAADAAAVVSRKGSEPWEVAVQCGRAEAVKGIVALADEVPGLSEACTRCLSQGDGSGGMIPCTYRADTNELPWTCLGGRSCLVQPLIKGDDFSACYIVTAREIDGIKPFDRDLVSRLAPALAASVLANHYERGLEERVRQRTFELEVLYEMAQKLGTALNYDDLFAGIVKGLRPVMGHDIEVTLLHTADIQEILIYPRRPAGPKLTRCVLEKIVSAWEKLTGRTVPPILLANARVPAGWRVDEGGPIEGLASFFSIPLVVGPKREAIGLIMVAAEEEHAFDLGKIRLLQTVVSQASISIQRLRLLVAAQRRRLESVIEHLPDGVLLVTAGGEILISNGSAPEFLGRPSGWRPGERLERVGEMALADLLDRPDGECVEVAVEAEGKGRILMMSAHPVSDSAGSGQTFVVVLRDVTRARAIEEQAATQQRLAAIGQLAGGVAHDFNNILMAVIGKCDLARGMVRAGDPVAEKLAGIKTAGEWATRLTRQLLAFSRRQTLQSEVLDLNKVVTNLENMLRVLIGEAISLELMLGQDLGRVEADPRQMEQIVMNLAVNARDAMPDGGKLIIETANVELDEEYAGKHPNVVPGRYVMVAVTDTGFGMGAETRRRIFEPFFTTKERGRGTGMGLSSVYGIVKQSGGNIWVYSEPGQGTVFKVYLPRTGAEPVAEVEKPAEREDATRGRGEQVLVVEDEPVLQEVVKEMLVGLGYRVAVAPGGAEALVAVREKGLRPELLLTDVVMPGMSGAVLVERLRETAPDLKVLYMSGYTDNVIVHQGVLDPGVSFIEKPFDIGRLAVKIRETLRG